MRNGILANFVPGFFIRACTFMLKQNLGPDLNIFRIIFADFAVASRSTNCNFPVSMCDYGTNNQLYEIGLWSKNAEVLNNLQVL